MSHAVLRLSCCSGCSLCFQDGNTSAAYRGPTAPATCLALGGPGGKTLFVGSWDKAVWSFDRDTRQPGRKYVGHSDFVKAVVCGQLRSSSGGEDAKPRDVLISGSADKKIIVWDVATGQRLHTLQDSGPTVSDRQSMLAVQDLAVDPVATTPAEIWLVSASSDPRIRRWRVRLDGWEQVVETGGDAEAPDAGRTQKSLLAHETTIYKLVFEDYNYSGGSGGDIEDEDEDVDLWTSSADGTAKCLSRLRGFRHGGSSSGGEASTYQHGSHVRAVAVTDAWVITAGRDEDLQYWDRTGAASADDAEQPAAGGNARYATITGHYDEVTGLAVLAGRKRLCSVSLDGTVRTWPLAKAEVEALIKQQKEDLAAGGQPEAAAEPGPEGLMTAEEEAELAALLGDDD